MGMFNVSPEVVYQWLHVCYLPGRGQVTHPVPHRVTWQAWRSLVTPWVAWHRRHSSWCLWGSHILLLCILHICSLSHCECNDMCNQLWSNHTYSINLLFSLYSIIFHYFHYFYHYHHYSHFAAESGTYLFMTLLCCSEMCFHSFTSSNIFVLCCFIPLGSTGCLVCDTAFGMQHTKVLGGMCNLAIFGWYLGHLESPITPGTCLVLMWIFHIFILSNLKL